MLIPLPIGSLRIACTAALKAAVESSEADRIKFYTKTFDQLLEGATHNGLKATIEDKQKMSEMAARDVQHAMESHPSQHIVKHIELMLAMADYTEHSDEADGSVVIDTAEFALLKDHLPKRQERD